MLDHVYDKMNLIHKIRDGKGWALPIAAIEAINFHLSIANPNADRDDWARLAGMSLIAENDDWPFRMDITEELTRFLLAVRKGETTLKANTMLSYVEAYRIWKRGNTSNSNQELRSTGEVNVDPFKLPNALNAKNWACEYEDCFREVVMPGDLIATHVEVKHCLRDLLEGIENHLNDHKQSGTVSGFDAELRSRYIEAEKLWFNLSGKKWERLQPREKGYLKIDV